MAATKKNPTSKELVQEAGNEAGNGGAVRALRWAPRILAGVALAFAVWRVITAQALDGGAVAAGVIAAALAWASFARAPERMGQGFKSGAAAVVYTLFAIGSAAVVFGFAARHDRKVDLTAFRRHSLEPTVATWLKLLGKDVEIVVFAAEDTEFRDLLNRFAEAGPMVSWKLVDPRRDPVYTREFGGDVVDGVVAVRHGDKIKKLAKGELAENTLANAIVEVTRDRDIKVYFLMGHGELAFDAVKEDPNTSISAYQKFLGERAIRVAPLNLLEKGFVPSDANVLVLAGPARDLAEAEARQIREFLLAGGRALIMFDTPKATGETIPYPNLVGLLRTFGLDDRDQVIIDLEGKRLFEHPLKVPVQWFNGDHPIGAEMARARGGDMVLSLVRKLAMTDQKTFRVTPVVGSSPQAWSEPFRNLGREVSPPKQVGVEPILWAVDAKAPGPGETVAPPPTRLAVFGTSEPARDSVVTLNNAAALLMLHTMNWLTEQHDTIPAPRKVVKGTPITLTAGQLKSTLILVTFVFPGAILAGGWFVSRRARRDSE